MVIITPTNDKGAGIMDKHRNSVLMSDLATSNRKQHDITWDKRGLELGSTGLTGGLPISFRLTALSS